MASPAASVEEVAPQLARRRTDIDGLRAVAAAAVVANHLESDWLPGGFTGVDCFFVISGYVVTLSSRRASHSATPLRSSLAFYARRIRRLLPLSVTVVAATALATSALVPDDETEARAVFFTSAWYSLIGWANNYFVQRKLSGAGGGYWGEGRSGATWNPFTHFWSLGVEEQFYLVYEPPTET